MEAYTFNVMETSERLRYALAHDKNRNKSFLVVSVSHARFLVEILQKGGEYRIWDGDLITGAVQNHLPEYVSPAWSESAHKQMSKGPIDSNDAFSGVVLVALIISEQPGSTEEPMDLVSRIIDKKVRVELRDGSLVLLPPNRSLPLSHTLHGREAD